jgi:predicted dehydrogenase
MVKRILIIGKGSIGKKHFEHLSNLLPDSEIKFLRHSQIDEKERNSNNDFYSIDEALGFAPELSVISNPASKHIETATIFAQQGSHLFIEKPVSHNVQKVQQLIDLCESKKLTLAVGYNLRFLESLIKFKDAIQAGMIGKLISIRVDSGSHLPDWRSGMDYRKSVSAIEDLGGGVLRELSHEIDYVRWIFGEIDWVKATLINTQVLGLNVEDTAHLVFGLRRNPEGLLVTCQMNLDFVRRDRRRTCMAIGTLGSLEWDGISGEVRLFDVTEQSWISTAVAENLLLQSYEDQWIDVLACIETGDKPKVTGEDGLLVMKIVDATRKSSSSGRMIQIDYST